MPFPVSHPLALERLADARRPDGSIDPLSAAVAVATHYKPTIKPVEVEAALDGFAKDVRHMLAFNNPPVRSLQHVLFERHGFTGNRESYNDPLNSYIDQVLTRRRGLPILLSLVYVETARRAGLAAHGIGLPGHFIAALDPAGGPSQRVFVDPFHRGGTLSVEDCRRTAQAAQTPWLEAYLEPVTGLAWATRMLANLRNTYRSMPDPANLAAVLEQIILLHPQDPTAAAELQSVYKDLDRGIASSN